MSIESQVSEYGRDLMWLLGVILLALYLFRTRSGPALIVAWAVEALVVVAGGFLLRTRSLRMAGLGLFGAVFAHSIVLDFPKAGPVLGFDGPLVVASVGVAAYVAAGFLFRERESTTDTASIASQLEENGRDLMWLLGVTLLAFYLFRTQSGSILIVSWAVEGLVVTLGGFFFRTQPLRLAGLGLLGLALAMTLITAFTTFDMLGRIVSFTVLGLVLLLVSLGYTRYRQKLHKSS